MPSSRRIVQLDVLRAMAIFLVMGRHLPPWQEKFPAFIQPAANHWIGVGWIGVDLFFVLSGFLISGLLFGEYLRYGRLSIGRFLIRRGFKIYPPFYLLIAAIFYIQWSNYNYHLIRAPAVLSELFFIQNYHPGLINHTWTLAVEEHFYLLLPLALGFMIRRDGKQDQPFKRLPLICLVLMLAALGARIATVSLLPQNDRRNVIPTHLRFDSLLFGVVISYYYHFFPEQTLWFSRRFRWLLIAAGAALLVPIYIQPLVLAPFDCTFGFSFVYVGFGLILLGSLALTIPVTGWRSVPYRVLAFVGSHSYSIYLWHMPIKIWGPMYCQRWFGLKRSLTSDLLIYFCGSIGGGILLSLVIEKPVLFIRDRLFPSRSAALERIASDNTAVQTPAPPVATENPAPIPPLREGLPDAG